MPKAIITKFALTTGVFTTDYEVGTIGLIRTPKSGHFHPREWCTTRAEAINRVMQMRAKALDALDRRREKLLKLDPVAVIDALDIG